VGADNRVSLRTVKTGKQAGSLRIIAEGLKPGERVITEGLQRISDGMEVRPRSASTEPDSGAISAPTGQSAAPAPSATPARQG
jgi:hypothetical protein